MCMAAGPYDMYAISTLGLLEGGLENEDNSSLSLAS